MAEEQRLTAAELLQYFLSRYRVEDGAKSAPDVSEATPIAEPVAAAAAEDGAEADGG